MNVIRAICLFEFKRVFQNRSSWISMFVLPILFALIFGGLTGNKEEKMNLAVVDQDVTASSRLLIERLRHDPLLHIAIDTEVNAKIQLHDQAIAGFIVIPKGLERSLQSGTKAEVSFQHVPNLRAAVYIDQTLQNTLARLAIDMQAAYAWSQQTHQPDNLAYYSRLAQSTVSDSVPLHITNVTKNRETLQLTGITESSIGFSMMFLMSTLVSVTGIILEARKLGIWYRLMATPVNRLQILVGYLLSFFLTGWIQFGILMGISSLLFGIRWGDGIGIFVLVSSMILTVVGLGLCIAGFVKTVEQQNALGTIVVVSTCMLGGVYWPLDIVPDAIRKLGQLVPQYWAINGFTELVVRGGTLMEIRMPVMVLLGFAVLFLYVGIKRVRFE